MMVMEELTQGGYPEEFNSENVDNTDMVAMGQLLAKIHKLPTTTSSKAAMLARQLVLEQGMDEGVVEELYHSRGGYILFLIYWWNTAFPDWMSRHSPTNYPLPQLFRDRFLHLVMRIGRLQARTVVLARHGFCHNDTWHSNLLWRSGQLVAIDCETASTGPAFLDCGGIVWNGECADGYRAHLRRDLREDLVVSFYQTVGETCEDIEDALYDLELAYLHRQLWAILADFCELVGKPFATVEQIGGLFMEKTEMMVAGMERAVDDKDVMKDVVEKGIYWAIRHQRREGDEECERNYVSMMKNSTHI